MKVFVFIACLITMVSSLAAEQTLPHVNFRGEIVQDDASFPNDFVVELRSLSHPQPSERTAVMNDGRFEFHNLEIGAYDMKITDGRGLVIQEEMIDVREA